MSRRRILERKIEQHMESVNVIERELRELNNKPHHVIAIHCGECGKEFSYLEDEVVHIDDEPVCWCCFDEKKNV